MDTRESVSYTHLDVYKRQIDGCTRLGVFFRIVLPNAKPAIATTAILSFRSVWNEFLWPMLVINDYDKLTLTVGLKYLKEWEPNWAVLLAGASLSICLLYTSTSP